MDDESMTERLAQAIRRACAPVQQRGRMFPTRGTRAVMLANAREIAQEVMRCLRCVAEVKPRGIVATGTAGRMLAEALPAEITVAGERIRCAWWLLELLNGLADGEAITFRGPGPRRKYSSFRFRWEYLLDGYEAGVLKLAPPGVVTPTTRVEKAIHILESVAWTVDQDELANTIAEVRRMPKSGKRTALLRDCATLRRYPKRFHFRHHTDHRGRYYQSAPVRWQSDKVLRRALRFADCADQEIESLDATSNGLQHIGVLLNDPRLMQMTRIAASAEGTPHIYDAIMANVEQTLREHPDRALAANLLDTLWRAHDDQGRPRAREYVKGVVMRFPYGGTSSSTRRAFDELYPWSPEDLELERARRMWLLAALIAEYGIPAGESEAAFWRNFKQARHEAGEGQWNKAKARLKRDPEVWPKLEREQLAVLWSRVVRAELEREASPLAHASALLDWFRDAAQAVRDAGSNPDYQPGPSWIVQATGFRVERHRTPYKVVERLRLQWNGTVSQVRTTVKLVELSDREDFNPDGTERIARARDDRAAHVHRDRLKRVSSFAPNFIHSLDAAVCTWLVCTLAETYPGVPVVANHDSWGMPEGYAGALKEAFQDAMRHVHDSQPLLQLYEALKQQVPNLPPPPSARPGYRRYGPTVDVLFGNPLR